VRVCVCVCICVCVCVWACVCMCVHVRVCVWIQQWVSVRSSYVQFTLFHLWNFHNDIQYLQYLQTNPPIVAVVGFSRDFWKQRPINLRKSPLCWGLFCKGHLTLYACEVVATCRLLKVWPFAKEPCIFFQLEPNHQGSLCGRALWK